MAKNENYNAPVDITHTRKDDRFPDGTLTVISASGFCAFAAGQRVEPEDVAAVKAAVAAEAEHREVAKAHRLKAAGGLLSKEAMELAGDDPNVAKAVRTLERAIIKSTTPPEPEGEGEGEAKKE